MAMGAELRAPLMYRLLTTVKSAELLRRSTFLSSDPIFGIAKRKMQVDQLGIETTMIPLQKGNRSQRQLVLYGLDLDSKAACDNLLEKLK